MSSRHHFRLLSGFVLSLLGSLFAWTAFATDRLPSGLIYHGLEGDTLLAVDKSACTLHLFEFSGAWKLKTTYPCESGKVSGNKQIEGDQKTPVGIYRFRRKLSDQWLNRQYGPKVAAVYGSGALVTNYPNFIDRYFYRKTGSGIWVHGTEASEPLATRGCISLSNDQLLELKPFVELNYTPILIEEQLQWRSSWDLVQERQQILEFLQTWLTSWEQSDNSVYLELYSEDFRTRKYSARAWKRYKKDVNELYRDKKIQVQVLSILRAGGVIEVRLFQDYQAPHLQTSGLKTLYLRAIPGGYRIISERWGTPSRQEFAALEANQFPLVMNGTPTEAIAEASPEKEPLVAALNFPRTAPEPSISQVVTGSEFQVIDEDESGIVSFPEGYRSLKETAAGSSKPLPEPVDLETSGLSNGWLTQNDSEPAPPVRPVLVQIDDAVSAPGWLTQGDPEPEPLPAPSLVELDLPLPHSGWLTSADEAPWPPVFLQVAEGSAAPSVEAGIPEPAPELPLTALGFLEKWRLLWEQGTVEGYLTLYAPDFRGASMSLEEWSRHKRRAARLNQKRQIRLLPLEVQSTDDEVHIRMLQDYSSNRVSDYGVKELVLRPKNGSFEILQEEWQALGRQEFLALHRKASSLEIP